MTVFGPVTSLMREYAFFGCSANSSAFIEPSLGDFCAADAEVI
jgi:hypothetical protein